MPRAIEEVDHLRRLVNRSLNPSVLDDDLVAPEMEMDWDDAPLVKATGDRDLQQWFATLAASDLDDR
jgi:hypothetical protein